MRNQPAQIFAPCIIGRIRLLLRRRAARRVRPRSPPSDEDADAIWPTPWMSPGCHP